MLIESLLWNYAPYCWIWWFCFDANLWTLSCQLENENCLSPRLVIGKLSVQRLILWVAKLHKTIRFIISFIHSIVETFDVHKFCSREVLMPRCQNYGSEGNVNYLNFFFKFINRIVFLHLSFKNTRGLCKIMIS